ncbi:MAG: hypothetical protein DRJ42_27190 [Deltaproteobacteria bacterium]|nr:MAG: hypothetical protein DRJ42_27190 [Deltaproteobacteria bacterium]
MASLSVRKLDRATYERLRVRAAERGTSMEEEARRIITQAVSAPARLGDLFVERFRDAGGVEIEVKNHPAHEPVDL